MPQRPARRGGRSAMTTSLTETFFSAMPLMPLAPLRRSYFYYFASAAARDCSSGETMRRSVMTSLSQSRDI